MENSLGRNYANRTGHSNFLGHEGDLIVKSTLIGSMENQDDTSNLQSLRLTINNVDLSRGTLTLHIGYKTIHNFGVAEIMLSEYELEDNNNPDLGMIVKYYFKKTNQFGNDLAIAWKQITKSGNKHWEIILKRNGDETTFNFVTLRYELSSPTVIGNYDNSGDTTKVICTRGNKFSDNSEPDASSFTGIKDPSEAKLPLGSIISWYPLANKSIDSLIEDGTGSFNPTNDYIKNLTNGEWELCDGNETIVNGVTYQKPDLRGRFVMGYGDKTNGKYMTDSGISYGEYTCPDDSPEELPPYNKDYFRHEESGSKATEGINRNEVIVNCNKIGNTGGFFVTKLLPKQQGSLFMVAGSGCGDNANDCRSMNAVAFAFSKPEYDSLFYNIDWMSTPIKNNLNIRKRNDSDCYNDTSGIKEPTADSPDNMFGTDNMQAFLGTKDNLKGKWGPRYNYARVLLGEGASPHDNKPPYIVCAYIVKVK